MATKRMLIDASHPEETRVAVVDGKRLEEYDVEVATRRQLKGNIYLAKVTRVEPSLQAAFVDYGGNRHGFLAFSEIHPDYYQIPVADRQALLAEQAAADQATDDQLVDADDDEDEIERRRPRVSSRHYKIQEVIKRRQILLVQVTKEERGSKGAALTTYLSLAGRYCVLMPNTSRGGGISRKISSVTDRKRLKKILSELDVAEGMAVIVRTAGAGRTKAEIKRDYEYLLRLWSNIRETTLQSTAPTLVYEEGSLIKRSIRDLYDRDTEEIIVQGEPQYRVAKEFMKLFIPSHAKRVKLYEDTDRPLFHEAQIEDQIEAMYQPIVHLKSGSYIVINPTEALVAIDVNSGRATRERHIEETALRTNLEAADEIARQLRLRDLAGLIVIDFIDMENPRNQTQVERRLKEAMKHDRARVQIGRISPFGLLELSRQRMRPSVIETSFQPCPMCHATGLMRTIESAALALLRRIEDEGIRSKAGEIVVTAGSEIALYLLNYKRRALSSIEERYGFLVRVVNDPTMIGHEFKLERLKVASAQPTARVDEETGEAAEEEGAVRAGEAAETEGEEAAKRGRRRRPRRKRRGEEERGEVAVSDGELIAAAENEAGVIALSEAEAAAEEEEEDEEGEEAEAEEAAEGESAGEPAKRRRRRGKRGGRRRARRPAEEGVERPVVAAEPPVAGTIALAAGGLSEAVSTADELTAGLAEAAPAAPLVEGIPPGDERAHEETETVVAIAGEGESAAEPFTPAVPIATVLIEAVAEGEEPPAAGIQEEAARLALRTDDQPHNEPEGVVTGEPSTVETIGGEAQQVGEPPAVLTVVEAANDVGPPSEALEGETIGGGASLDAVEAPGGEADTVRELAEFDAEAEPPAADTTTDTATAGHLDEGAPPTIAGNDDEGEESLTRRRGWWQRLMT